MYDIYEYFDIFPSLETRPEFLDMLTAFDRVWQEGLVYKIKKVDVSDNLLTLFQSFLNNKHQRVLLDGQNSHWKMIKAGVLHGPLLGPLLY